MEGMYNLIVILTWVSCVGTIVIISWFFYEEYKLHKEIKSIPHEFRCGEKVLYNDADFIVTKVNKYTLEIKHGITLTVYKNDVKYKNTLTIIEE